MANNSTNSPLWDMLPQDRQEQERIVRKNTSFAQDVWSRFYRKPTAILGLVVIFLLTLFATLGPSFTNHKYDKQNLDFVNIPPFFTAQEMEGRYFYLTQNLKIIEVAADGTLLGALPRPEDNGVKKRMTFTLEDGTTLVINYKVKPARLEDGSGNPLETPVRMRNASYPLGTDGLGRDILTRLMYGTRISLLIALIAATVNLIIGILFGGASGYFGGTLDVVMMRIVDIISTIPLTLYVILIQVILQGSSGIVSIVIALGTVYWVNMARVVRGQVLSIKEEEFVYAAKTIGTSTPKIILTHLIPNAMGPIIVTVTMLIPSAIFIEAFMSFIGLGVAPPMASLGTMSNDALATLRTSPYQLFIPAAAICLLMFAFNFVGDGLRDALDPKLRK